MALQHLRSSTANKRPVPGNMSDGQLGVNTNSTSPGLFFKDSNGNLVKVGPVHVGTTAPNASPAVGGTAGNSVGEQWLDTSSSRYVFKVWDGSAWRSEAGEFVDVAGDVMTGALGIIAGSAGSPGLYVSGDANTGLYSPGADQLALATGGSERLRLDSSGGFQLKGAGTAGVTQAVSFNGSAPVNSLVITSEGLVGLGTSAPDSTLNVRAGANNTAAEDIASFSRPDAAVRAAITKGLIGGTTNGIAFGTTTNHPFALNTNGSERIYITNAGLVGIGTMSPATLLHLSSATGSAAPSPTELRIATRTVASDWSVTNPWGRISFYNEDGSGSGPKIHAAIDATALTTVGGTSDLVFSTNNNSSNTLEARMVIKGDSATAGARVGIGVTTPGGALDIKAVATISPLVVQGPSSEFARIDSSGRLLVGTSTSLGTTAKAIEAASNIAISSFIANEFSYQLTFNKSRGATNGTIVQNGDEIGKILFRADDGTDTDSTAAQITAAVDGTPGANDMPGRLVLSTTSDGASSPSERLRVTSDGYVRLSSSSPGIQFGGDTAAANALDDYEEGTFTPSIVGTSTAGTATYAANGRVGRYTKIGNRVFFDIYLSWTAHTGTGNLQIDGLPFTVQNTTNLNRNYTAIFSGVALTAGNIGAAYTAPGSDGIALRQMPTGGGSVAVIPMDTSAQISISGCFDAA